MSVKICPSVEILRRQLQRMLSSTTSTQNSVDKELLDAALQQLFAEHGSVPIAVGNKLIFTGDEQRLRMPHNHRRITAKYYLANKTHITSAITKGMTVQEQWASTDLKSRSEILCKAADYLSQPERKAYLMASIMLSQAKTRQETEEDVGRMIHMLKQHADYVIKLSEMKLNPASDKYKTKFLLRPLDGFVIVSGPIYMSWLAACLAIAPLIMGNVVLWRPPANSVLTSFLVFKAIMKSGVPRGAFNFLPANYKLFFGTAIQSPDLAGINYAGRVATLRNLWCDVSIHLAKYKCFPRLVGECDGKGFHFVHESADLERVLQCTVKAAFRFSGQRPLSCARFYVPSSMWEELKCDLLEMVECLQVGDPLDDNSFASAIIKGDLFDEVVKEIELAKCNNNVEILCGGHYNNTHGFFVEPTVVLCRNPNDRLMTNDIMGPILSVFVYDNNKLDETLEVVKSTQQFGTCGAVFSTDAQITEKILRKLRMTASNLYVNEQCLSNEDGHLPLSGNRLSGTNDKNGSAYYLLRFTAPQIIEESIGDVQQNANIENLNC